jgi:hypothetical protein
MIEVQSQPFRDQEKRLLCLDVEADGIQFIGSGDLQTALNAAEAYFGGLNSEPVVGSIEQVVPSIRLPLLTRIGPDLLIAGSTKESGLDAKAAFHEVIAR